MSAPTPPNRRRNGAGRRPGGQRPVPEAPLPDGEVRDVRDAPPDVVLDLDALDKAAYVPDAVLEPFTFRHAGRDWQLCDPRDLDWRDLMRGIRNPASFMGMALPEDQQEEFLETPCEGWKMDALFTNWQAHYKVTGLGEVLGLRPS